MQTRALLVLLAPFLALDCRVICVPQATTFGLVMGHTYTGVLS
jgi:hypothetical protein